MNSDMNKRKTMHISFDDVCTCLYDITKKSYLSIFEYSFFNDLKIMHETYGAVFTLNCFNTNTQNIDYDISKLPATYSTELSNNCDWLKFSFHAQDNNTNYGDGKNGTSTGGKPEGDCIADIKKAYKKFTDAIISFAGTANSIDQVIRLGFFGATIANVKTLTECQYGLIGLLAADDTRISYYLNKDENDLLLSNGEYYEKLNKIKIIKSQKRLENVKDAEKQLAEFDLYQGNILEVFTHEQCYNESVKVTLIKYLEYANKRQIKFDFVQNNM